MIGQWIYATIYAMTAALQYSYGTTYLTMVEIEFDFIPAEKLGSWEDQLNAIKKWFRIFMLPVFPYAKLTHLYLQHMLVLEENMNKSTFRKKGRFSRSNKWIAELVLPW